MDFDKEVVKAIKGRLIMMFSVMQGQLENQSYDLARLRERQDRMISNLARLLYG